MHDTRPLFLWSRFHRMVLTPYGGTYFDNKSERKKKWQWYNNNHSNHVHAPPFQPVTFAMTKELSVRCMGQVCDRTNTVERKYG